MTVRIGVTSMPAQVRRIARDLMLAAMALDEDANNVVDGETLELFDNMLESMAGMKEALIQAYAEIEIG